MQGSASPAVPVVVEANATERESPAALPGLRRDFAAGASPPCPPQPGPPGRRLGGPHQSTHAVNNCPLFWSYGPQPPLRALPRRLSSDQREAQTNCWRLSPTPYPVWDQRAKDPSAHDGGLVLVPTPLLAPGLELQNTSRAVGGRDTPEPLSALSQP